MSQDVYQKLARHLEGLVSGYPYSDALLDLLKENFDPDQAQLALAIPNSLAPLETESLENIAASAGVEQNKALEVLESLAQRGSIYSGPAPDGSKGYAHLQVGYGMPQVFFWGGQSDERAKRMAKRVLKYFTVETTRRVYGGRDSKTYKYIPVGLSVEMEQQGVLPFEAIRPIVENARSIAVCYCPCRTSARVLGRTDCQHSLEVCLKYDEMADFVIERGLGRAISADEALDILRKCEEEGLVHMVDNVAVGAKHTCNCCGCYCWNVGIIRRRKVPRDQLMASYFMRTTDEGECIGCGACVDICPVEAVSLDGDIAKVDQDWCIGCGVCAVQCPTEAIGVERRHDVDPPRDLAELVARIRRERRAHLND